MYYSSIGLLAILILLIENQDVFFNLRGALEKPAWKVYRRFLYAVLLHYVMDVLWGLLESLKLPRLLFADTTVYYISIAVGVLFWAEYTVAYLEDNDGFGRLLVYAGRIIAGLITLLAVVNIFKPVLFTVDSGSVYHPLFLRYVMLVCQILLLFLISSYAVSFIIPFPSGKRKKSSTLALFGMMMGVFLFVQLWFPYLPIYSVAYIIGTSLLHTFVVNDEKAEYKRGLEEAVRIRELKDTISSLLDNIPGMTFTKDAATGVYLACNQAFAEYAHKENPEGVAGLTDAQIFDAKTAKHFVEDDQMALSMERPYIFFEDVPDAVGNRRQLQTTKLKYTDMTGRLCVLGICEDVTDLTRIRHENATTKEAYEKARSTSIMYSHIAQALARGYKKLYYVNVDTEEYIEYRTDDINGSLKEVRRGWHFFEECQIEAEQHIYQADRAAFLKALDRKTLMAALDRNKTFVMTYRLLLKKGPTYVSMKISRMVDDERYMIIGVTDVDEQMKQRRAAERMNEEKIAYTRLNALSGDFLCVYVIVPQTGRYREFSSTSGYETLALPKDGMDFFGTTRETARRVNHPEDLNRFLTAFTREKVLEEIKRYGIFTLSYRIILEKKPLYVQLRAAMVEETEGPRLVVGISNIDAQVRQEEEYVKHLAKARIEANIDALTGVKNKHAYLAAQEHLDRQIEEHHAPEFAIVILDVNDLKRINDTEGHNAGDQYIRDACKIICNIFKRSPVFRVGGDEFAVIAQGNDYMCIEELIGRVSDHNTESLKSGGVVIACGMAIHEDDDCVARVFERADQNMYENKNELKAEKSRKE